MTSLLILGASSLAQRHLITAARASGVFSRVEVASRREVQVEGADAIYLGYETALDESPAQTVYVSLVNSEHATWAQRSLESGRHTIVDKPAFLDLSTAYRLVEYARNRKVALAEATVWPFHPQIAIMKQMFADAGQVPSRAVALFSMPPFAPDNFRWQQKLGGGALYDLGPYMASVGRVLFGGAAAHIHGTVNARHSSGVPVSFSVEANWNRGNSLVGHFGFDTEYVNRLEVLGDGMRLSLDRVFTTPSDLENTLRISTENSHRNEIAPAANSFECFFKQFAKNLVNGQWQQWTEDLLADAATLHKCVNGLKKVTA